MVRFDELLSHFELRNTRSTSVTPWAERSNNVKKTFSLITVVQ